MSDIPTARVEIQNLIDGLRTGSVSTLSGADELERSVLPKLYRNRKVRQAPVQSRAMTPALGNSARSLASSSRLSEAEIAAKLGVNPGRISEALNGRWT